MDNRCSATTVKNEQCKIPTEEKHIYCNLHLQKCQDYMKSYQGVCKRIWYEACLFEDTDKDIDWIIDEVVMCITLRVQFAEDCCDGKYDSAHLGAIRKMEEKLMNCNKINKVKSIPWEVGWDSG